MNNLNTFFEDYLFGVKQCLVVCGQPSNCFETAFTLAKGYGIQLPAQKVQLLNEEVLNVVRRNLPDKLSGEFYKGFPQSVHSLAASQIVFDQLYHYFNTYVQGDFSKPGESVFEKSFERVAFAGKPAWKKFDVLTYDQAIVEIDTTMQNLCKSTRPLNNMDMRFVQNYVQLFGKIYPIAGKTNLCKLVCTIGSKEIVDQLYLSDVYKLVGFIAYSNTYGEFDAMNYRMQNKYKRLVTKVIDNAFAIGKADVVNCYEKRDFWCGLLHQIHYKPCSEAAQKFCIAIRSKQGKSVYSHFEKLLKQGDVVEAAKLLVDKKGVNALVRNVDYVLSRCTLDQVEEVLRLIDLTNPLCALQLYARNSIAVSATREFVYTKNNLVVRHTETKEEADRRKTILPLEIKQKVDQALKSALQKRFAGKLQSVYIEDSFKTVALPLYESDSAPGLGTLTKGSRVPFESKMIFRAFVNWSKCNDVDLACFGIGKDGEVVEFSWRNTHRYQTVRAVTYSGDQTSGYNGGSEYFDVNFKKFASTYRNCDYVVFTANCYSMENFSEFPCKAGFMLRDNAYVGKIYEPSTVKTAYNVTAQGTYCVLFALDIKRKEIVWLNVARDGFYPIAGEDKLDFVYKFLNVTDVLSVYSLFQIAGATFVDDASQAKYVVSDNVESVREDQVLIRSYDYTPLIPLINGIF